MSRSRGHHSSPTGCFLTDEARGRSSERKRRHWGRYASCRSGSGCPAAAGSEWIGSAAEPAAGHQQCDEQACRHLLSLTALCLWFVYERSIELQARLVFVPTELESKSNLLWAPSGLLCSELWNYRCFQDQSSNLGAAVWSAAWWVQSTLTSCSQLCKNDLWAVYTNHGSVGFHKVPTTSMLTHS